MAVDNYVKMENFLNKLKLLSPNRKDLEDLGYDDDFMGAFDPLNQEELPKNIKDIEALLIFGDIDNWTIGNLSLGGEYDLFPGFIVLASFDGGFILKDKNDKSFHFKFADDHLIEFMCEGEKQFLEILLLLAKDYTLRMTNNMDEEGKENILIRCNKISPNFPFDLLM